MPPDVVLLASRLDTVVSSSSVNDVPTPVPMPVVAFRTRSVAVMLLAAPLRSVMAAAAFSVTRSPTALTVLTAMLPATVVSVTSPPAPPAVTDVAVRVLPASTMMSPLVVLTLVSVMASVSVI